LEDKAQGAFEYILLLAGILLIVVLVIVLMKGVLTGPTNQTIQQGVGQYNQSIATMYPNAS
jgi:hypothetical protein